MSLSMNAQKSRGVETEGNLFIRAKAFLPILIPLVLSSIAANEEKALTLEARGFSMPVQKTQLIDIPKAKRDQLLAISITVLTIVIVIWRIVTWVI